VLSVRRPTGRRIASLCIVALLALATAAVAAPVAMSATPGGGNSFNELTEGQPEATKTATQARGVTNATETTNSRSLIILAMVAAVMLLIGIAYVIARDARRAAPQSDPQLAAGAGSADWAAKQRRRRAKAKAARQQRKRNR
jgi:hypothetical protein